MRALLLVVALTGAAAADSKRDYEGGKKDAFRATKSTKHRDVPVAGAKPPKLVNLFNEHTHEWLAIDPTTKVPAAVANRFLRDHYTNESIAMEPRLLEIVVSAVQHFKGDTAFIVSGFRHPKFNLLLRKKGHQVARDSHHTKGDAIDFYLPRVTTQELHRWASDQKIGGVGLYLDSGFIHMDTGPIRFWSGE